ncbi:beta strand repeat-containing protein [Bartonella schoenbuchensis]|uniref:beta strand repeat-containing protein n=1 Tax=Bartonella schoenbuchensis TaxID=165694 RepID=UPI0031453944
MVMRRVFNHHVCLCVLSTAILAGLALMTSQTKVYAGKNCNGLANSREDGDVSGGLIVCDGTGTGSGVKNGVGELSGKRNIDMSGRHDEAAVTITGPRTNIRIVAPLTVTDKGGSNTTAIKVHKGGKLVVMNATVDKVQKGIVVEGPSSSVTVMTGSIGVRAGGDAGPVIEVKGGGTVELMRGVTIKTVSGSNAGEVVIDGGGDVTLMGTRFNNVKTGIVVKGTTGMANVKGGATITVKQGGTGFKMEGQGTANVMDMTIKGSGGKGTGAEVTGSGALTMNNVKLMQLETGAKVTGQGTLKLEGSSTINVAAGGKGLEVSGGTADVVSTMITLQGDGSKGLVMKGGIANVTLTRITGSGSGTTGVEMEGSADVTLTSVNVLNVQKGITKGGSGALTLNGTTKIQVVGGGTGMSVSGGKVTMEGGSITGNGGSGTGLVMSGNADVTLNGVNISEVQKGVEMGGSGVLKLDGTTKINVGQNGTGMSVTGGNVVMTGTLRIEVKQGGTGMSVSNGTVMMNGTTTITVAAGGKGMSVGGGNVVMTGTLTITGSGTTGVQMSGGTVMMKDVNISEFTKGINMEAGESLTVEGGRIEGNGRSGVGINVTRGGDVTVEGVTISKFATGIDIMGDGSLTVEGGTTINVGRGGTGVKVGNSVTMTSLTGVTITKSGAGGEKGVEVKGGTVVMDRVGISNVGTGVLMETGVKSASLTDVNVSGVERGIAMEGSGEFMVNGTTTISFTGNYGVYAGEKVQSTTLTGVTITGNGGSESKGVWVKGGAVVMNTVGISGVTTGVLMEEKVTNASLTGVTITGVKMGISMKGSGTLTVEGVGISFTGTYGVYAGEKVQNTNLTGVTITGNGSGVGIFAMGGSLTVKDNTKITGVKAGIYATGSGELKVEEGTRIEFKADGYGVYAGGGVTKATLTGVTIVGNKSGGNGNGYGVLMGSTGNATLTRVNVSQVEMGIFAVGGVLMVSGGEIKEVEKGITMMGGTLTVRDSTTIQFTKDYGIKVGKGVTEATLTKVEIVGKEKGEGIYAMGGNLTVIGGEIKEVEKGITMMGGTLTVKDNTKIWFTKDYGIKLGGTVAKAELMGVKITGSNRGKGVVWESAGTLTLEKVEMLKVATGVEMKKGTLIMNEGTKINFMGEYGVMVGNAVTSATLTNVQIMGSNRGKTGVVMGSTGMLTSVNISGVTTGVEVTGKGMLTMTDGEIRFTEVGLKVEGETTATATVTGTKIVGEGNNGMMSKGVYVGKGNVTLTRVNVSKVETGIKMMGNGVLKVKEGTRIEFMAGGTGVMVGNSVTAHLTGVEIMGNKSGTGVEMRGKTMTITNVTLKDVETGVEVSKGDLTVIGGAMTQVQTGITMEGNGALMVNGGTRIEFTKDYGIKLGETVASAELTGVEIMGKEKGEGIYAEEGVLMVSGGSIKGVEKGITMMGYGRLTVKDSTRIEFTGDGYGVYVGDMVMASLTGTKIVGSGNNGVGVYTVGGEVVMKQVGISNVGTGVYAMGGTLIMKDGEIGFMRGYGVAIEGGAAALMGVNMTYKGDNRDPQDADVVSPSFIKVDGGKVVAEKVTITGNGKGNVQGLHVTQRGHVVLMNSTYTDVYSGMTIEEGTVRMFGGSVEFKGEHAISLTKGNAVLKDVNMTYKGDNRDPQGADVVSPSFIKVEDGVVLAEKLTMTGNGKDNIQGVKVANGGAVWLKNTTFTNVRSGMTIERGGIMRMEGGSITFTGGHGIDVSGGQAILSGFSITRQGDTSKATATGTGVGVSNSGKVMMRGVNISEVATGAYVTGYGLLVMDKGGITFKGKHGINLVSGYALLNGVKIMGPGSGTGIELGYGQVLMKDTTFTNVDKAITVTEGDVKMEGGEIEFKGEHGILLNQGGVALMGVTMRYKGNSTTADFIKITGEDTTNAVEAVDPKTKNTFTPKSAVVVAASLKIDGSGHGQALNVTNGGRVVLMNPTYTDVYTGMTITKGAVQMLGGEITFKGEHGILLNQGHALLTNVTMEYKGHEQNTTFLKVEAENVLNTADIIGTGIKIDGKGYGQGVHVTKGGRVKLKNAVFSDVVKGVSVVNGEFWMKGGEITFKGDYGVSLSTGKVLLKRVIMKYKGNNRGAKGTNTASPNFIKVDGRGANLAAIKVMITGNGKGNVQGVKVSNGGHVTLKQSHVPIQPTIHIIHNFIL